MSESISAEVSLYPLRVSDLGPAIAAFADELGMSRLQVQTGSMSTLIVGERDELFEALRNAFAAVSAHYQVVLSVTISNACPQPDL